MTQSPTTREGAGANNPAPAGAVFTAHDGAVFYRGSYLPGFRQAALLDHLRADPDPAWRALNQRLARELENAMAKAYHMDIAA